MANDGQGVCIDVEGPPDDVDTFVHRLRADPPPLARIDAIGVEDLQPRGERTFAIGPSDESQRSGAFVGADISPCSACLDEMGDRFSRRYRYPFTNCTNCGPRFTIVDRTPYDRSRTTMAPFAMCGECRREYEDPADRRFHAQPLCCPSCGPSLRLVDSAGVVMAEGDSGVLEATVRMIRAGRVVAIKGVGGYHLAADAASATAVSTLRSRKEREDRPFAIMVPDLDAARRLCDVSEEEAALLVGRERPIVILRRRSDTDHAVADAVAPRNDHLGVFLPPSPLHALIASDLALPVVMTSGNRSGEPIAYEDADALRRLGPIADAFCVHERQIRTRVDDSVARVVRGRTVPFRRARGHAPLPLALPLHVRSPILGCGAHLKSTFCLARGEQAFVSQHLGDLDDLATYEAYSASIEHYQTLFGIVPEIVAHDLHPDYGSTRFAAGRRDVEIVAVQHHHAHIASCMVDNGVLDAVIGVAFDGLGLGTDGTAWGGEVLIADLDGFDRIGHLRKVRMPGGDRAAEEPWRMAASYLDAMGSEHRAAIELRRRHEERWDTVTSMVRTGTSAPVTSSVGRLFDAVSSLVGVRDRSTYEGQAAVELEQQVDDREEGSYEVEIRGGGPFVLDGVGLVSSVASDVDAGVPRPIIAARFHNAVADLVAESCALARDESGIETVALSGGVFQNAALLTRSILRLEASGFRVLTHRQVPPNDGGISLGQVAIAGARHRSGLA